MTEVVHVAVAVVEDDECNILIAKRPQSKHMGGYWEFPGGKVEAGERVEDALKRELLEEVNVVIDKLSPLIQVPWQYENKHVFLDVFYCKPKSKTAIGLENQEIKWVARNELPNYQFPPANRSILNAIKLPDRLLITGSFIDAPDFFKKMDKALERGIKLAQIRGLNCESADASSIIKEIKSRYLNSSKGCEFILNAAPENARNYKFKNLHLKSSMLFEKDIAERILGFELVSASVHNIAELEVANNLHLDFILISPIKKTQSHDGVKILGWEKLQALVGDANMPVYALGGLNEVDLPQTKSVGAQGIAGISAFW